MTHDRNHDAERPGTRDRTRFLRWAATLGLGLSITLGLSSTGLLVWLLVERPRRTPCEGDAWPFVGLAALSTVGFLLATLSWRAARGLPRTRFWGRFSAVAYAALPALVILAVVGIRMPCTRSTDGSPRQSRCVENARLLAYALLYTVGDREGQWPSFSGKNFVLSLVADGSIDIRNMRNVEVLFASDGDGAPPRPGRAAYEEVDEATLSRRRFPTLTDFAGRRNLESRYRLAPGKGKGNEPTLACLHENGVVVAFDNGHVRFMRREALGLAPGDAIVFGDGSKSPLLEKLSDR